METVAHASPIVERCAKQPGNPALWRYLKQGYTRLSIADPGLDTMRAQYIIAIFSVPIVLVGIILGADLPLSMNWINFSTAGWGQTLFSLGADIVMVYLVIELLLLRDERRRWVAVEDRVNSLIGSELSGIVVDIWNVSGVYPVVTVLPDDSSKQAEAFQQAALAKMRRLTNDISALKHEAEEQNLLFKGAYGELFAHRAEKLGHLQLRYSFKFLEPKLMGVMIEVERLLKELDSDVRIYLKGGVFSEIYKEQGFLHLQDLLRILLGAIDDGMVKAHMPPTPQSG